MQGPVQGLEQFKVLDPVHASPGSGLRSSPGSWIPPVHDPGSYPVQSLLQSSVQDPIQSRVQDLVRSRVQDLFQSMIRMSAAPPPLPKVTLFFTQLIASFSPFKFLQIK